MRILTIRVESSDFDHWDPNRICVVFVARLAAYGAKTNHAPGLYVA